MRRQLITTADELTWPQDIKQPVLFLGEWCKLYSRKNNWEELDSKTHPHHWIDRKKLYADYQAMQITYEKTLSVLAAKLNEIHQVNHSLRYWRILVGPWLGVFIGILFDRYSVLESVFSSNDGYACCIIKQDNFSFVPNDMQDFEDFKFRDDWNEVIYGQLITAHWADKVETIWINQNKGHSFKKETSVKLKRKIRNRKIIAFIKQLYIRNDSYFFIGSYLPSKVQPKLQRRLGQIPNAWRPLPSPIAKYDNDIRSQWEILDIDAANGFENALQAMIPLHMPTLYLEGYEALSIAVKKLPWPKNPKAMFTSNSFWSDDMFKAWAAKKTETGTPLVIGQHGGAYGSSLFLQLEAHETKIADKWLSWGWQDVNQKNIVPVANLKIINNQVTYNPKGDAVMMESGANRYPSLTLPAPIAGQWLDYFNDQTTFLTELPNALQKRTLLRLKRGSGDWIGGVKNWYNIMPEVSVDKGNRNIKEIIRESRLCIVTYNATAHLETLAWNIPTIMFWNPKHWEMNEQAKPYFDLLESVGIFHTTPQSAAQKMTEVWDDIESWWQSNEVQQARKIFIVQYSATPGNALDLLQDVLLKAVNKKK